MDLCSSNPCCSKVSCTMKTATDVACGCRANKTLFTKRQQAGFGPQVMVTDPCSTISNI